MSLIKKVAFILLAIVMTVSLFPASMAISASAATQSPQWSQSIIDQAVGANLISMNTGDNNGSSAFKWNSNNHVSKVVHILALMSYYNPDLKASNGTKVSDRLITHLNRISSSGNEPSCRGSIGGWVDGPIAQAITLARHTPAVWGRLTTDVKNRLDFIMKALTVVGNYTQNYRNDPRKDLSQGYDCVKSWNPNMQEGYVGVMIAAYFYFGGADKVNQILADFRYDDYIAKMTEYGFLSMRGYFTKTGKNRLENPNNTAQKDAGGGTVYGARIPFTFKDYETGAEIPYDPVLIFRSLARRMYGKIVVSEVERNGKVWGHTINKNPDGTYKKTPYEGLMGMGTEFDGSDADGVRTCAIYFLLGWMNSVPTRCTIQALGAWKGEGINDIESRMYVGSEDFLFKVTPENGGGWHGYQKGKVKIDTEASLIEAGHGYVFTKEIWQKYLKNDLSFETKLTKSSNVVTATVKGYNLSATNSKNITIIAATYHQNRLEKIEIKPYTIAPLKTSYTISNFNINLPDQSRTVKLFIWDSLNGMQPLVEEVTTDITVDSDLLNKAKDLILTKTKALGARAGTKFPEGTNDGVYVLRDKPGWTAGFYPGINYLCYDMSGDEDYLQVARNASAKIWEAFLDNPQVYMHDLGFVFMNSYYKEYELTLSAAARNAVISAGDALMARVKPTGYIQAWDGSSHQYRMIADTMCNLPLLFTCSEFTGDPKYTNAAIKHAQITQQYIIRPDYTTAHTFIFNPDGSPKHEKTHQGYSDSSCWARGQAWVINGMAKSYLATGDESFLDSAKRCAGVFFAKTESDLIPRWDLIFTGNESEPRDTSAASIAACGFLDIYEATGDVYYKDKAYEIFKTLYERYAAGPSEEGIIGQGVAHKPAGSFVNSCLIYGDYYFAELTKRLLDMYS